MNVDDRTLVEIPVHWELGRRPILQLRAVARPEVSRCPARSRSTKSGHPDSKARIPLRSRVHPHHAPIHHRAPRPPPNAGAPDRTHQDLPQRPLLPRHRRGPSMACGVIPGRMRRPTPIDNPIQQCAILLPEPMSTSSPVTQHDPIHAHSTTSRSS